MRMTGGGLTERGPWRRRQFQRSCELLMTMKSVSAVPLTCLMWRSYDAGRAHVAARSVATPAVSPTVRHGS
jgi:hypothetical protein